LELSLSLDDVAVDLSDEKNLLLEDKVVHKHLFRWRRLIAMLPLKCMMKGDGDRADELYGFGRWLVQRRGRRSLLCELSSYT